MLRPLGAVVGQPGPQEGRPGAGVPGLEQGVSQGVGRPGVAGVASQGQPGQARRPRGRPRSARSKAYSPGNHQSPS